MCARRRTFFSCLAKKRRQKKATLLSASLRFAPGNLRCSVTGCAVELALRLQRAARTTTASQFTKRVCPAAHPPPRALRAPGASRRGGEQTTIRAVAALGRVFWARRARALGAERSDGP